MLSLDCWFYWDYDNRASRWVAYPLYKSIYSGASRSDAWGYDPLLPAAKQQNVSGGYREGNNGWYARDHGVETDGVLSPGAEDLGGEADAGSLRGTPLNRHNLRPHVARTRPGMTKAPREGALRQVRVKGLEPIRREAPDPKSGLSTNFNTPADRPQR